MSEPEHVPPTDPDAFPYAVQLDGDDWTLVPIQDVELEPEDAEEAA